MARCNFASQLGPHLFGFDSLSRRLASAICSISLRGPQRGAAGEGERAGRVPYSSASKAALGVQLCRGSEIGISEAAYHAPPVVRWRKLNPPRLIGRETRASSDSRSVAKAIPATYSRLSKSIGQHLTFWYKNVLD